MSENQTIIPGLRSAAAARSAALETRVRIVATIAACCDSSCANLAYYRAGHDRSAFEAENSRSIRSLEARIQNITAAVAHARKSAQSAESQQTIEDGDRELKGLQRQLTELANERSFTLASLAQQIEDLEAARKKSAEQLAEAMRELNVSAISVTELVDRADIPGLDELMLVTETSERARRARLILALARQEAERAATERDRVGLSVTYDQALLQLIDAEKAHEACRQAEKRAVEQRTVMYRRLSEAQMALRRAELAPPKPAAATNGGADGDASESSGPGERLAATSYGDDAPSSGAAPRSPDLEPVRIRVSPEILEMRPLTTSSAGGSQP